MINTDFMNAIQWTQDGLVPVIAEDSESGKTLMMAWMNRESLALSVENAKAVYWSRSRQRLWRKGESSGHEQLIKEIRIDCDADVIIIKVQQLGGIACHTGRESCFYRVLSPLEQGPLEQGSSEQGFEWKAIDSVIKDPKEIYK